MSRPTLPGYHIIAKPIGPLCNLDCSYCFYLKKEKLYPGKHNWRMQPEVLESYVRQYIESQSVPEIWFTWQGGEPTLLGLDFFRRAVELQQQYANGKQIRNAFQTNGVLLNDEWCEFFSEHEFLVGISIDGPEDLHDHYRVDKGGGPSFAKVLRGLKFLQKHKVEFNTLTVVNKRNSQEPLAVYRFLKEIGSTVLQFIPIVERDAEDGSLAEWTVDPDDYGQFLISIFDEWVKKDVGKTFVQLFEVALESWVGIPQSLCFFRETCGEALAVEHNGDVYSCDHFVEPDFRLGNLMEDPLGTLVNSDQQHEFGQAKRDALPEYCKQCEVRFACNGECPKNRFETTPDGDPGLNYLCRGYRSFYNHIDPYMKFMVACLKQRRSPAAVMEFAKARAQVADKLGHP